MKMRHLSFFSLATACVFLTGGAALLGGSGCSSSSGRAAAAAPPARAGRAAGGGVTLDPENKISDFEDLAAATVVMAGRRPQRLLVHVQRRQPEGHGLDLRPDAAVRTADSRAAMPRLVVLPRRRRPRHRSGPTRRAARCTRRGWAARVWGAGIGADLNQPRQDGGTYTGKKVAYDVGAFTGITFWAMATTGLGHGAADQVPDERRDEGRRRRRLRREQRPTSAATTSATSSACRPTATGSRSP